MNYYGTELDCAGHYFFTCKNNRLERLKMPYEFFDTDFNPETLCDGLNLSLGKVEYRRIGKWTICYIEGSCYDKRGASKSVFFTDEKITFGDFVLKIMNIPICKKIIDQMPFKVRWGLNEEYTDKLNGRIQSLDELSLHDLKKQMQAYFKYIYSPEYHKDIDHPEFIRIHEEAIKKHFGVDIFNQLINNE